MRSINSSFYSEYNRPYAFVRRNIGVETFRHVILRKLSDDNTDNVFVVVTLGRFCPNNYVGSVVYLLCISGT